MGKKKQKLELTWIGKDDQPRLEPRILLEDKELSYQGPPSPDGNDINDNILIHGDNLLALKALEQEFTGKVKCIYIDPPYNTGSAFEHYDDGVEHSIWLSLMRSRLEIQRRLLTQDGFICCQIDDSENHYLKVLMDEVFGRENYLCTMYVRVRYPNKTLKQDMDFHKEVESIHVYRNSRLAVPNKPETQYSLEKFVYDFTVDTPSTTLTLGKKQVDIFPKGSYSIKKNQPSAAGLKEVWASGTILDGNSSGRFFRDYLQGREQIDGLGTLYRVHGIGNDRLEFRYFTGPKRIGATKGKYYQGVPIGKIENEKRHTPISTFLDFAADFGNCRHEGGVSFRSGKKPERLIKTLLEYFSKPGDIVLDSFAGSGTTGAVAHKLKRKWIMIELGEHAISHIIPRLHRVATGTDSTGVSEIEKTRPSGGFRYYRLAPSLLAKDKWGNWIVSPDYNPEMLSEAMCKVEGFTYAPSNDLFWMHGNSTETDYIYVTTQMLGRQQLQFISEQVGTERTLLICCSAYKTNGEDWTNLTLKKIPQAVLHRCEWNIEMSGNSYE